MLKTRKKWVSLLVVLAFVFTLLPAGLASAATFTKSGGTPTVSDDKVVDLGSVLWTAQETKLLSPCRRVSSSARPFRLQLLTRPAKFL